MVKMPFKKILEAALRVVAKEKISGTRMHLIAKEAGMSQANLHYYFATKNDLMLALLKYIQQELLNKRLEFVDLEKNFSENLGTLFKQNKDIILNYKEFNYVEIDYWVQGTINSEIRDIWQNTFTIWRNHIKETINQDKSLGYTKESDTLSYLIVSIIMGAILQYLIAEDSFDLDEYFTIAKDMLLNLLVKDTQET